jgi:branched-chain amino acid aminotransferase
MMALRKKKIMQVSSDQLIWFDDEFVPSSDARVHVLTHALHYATSVFEGIRFYNKKIFMAREHAERLLYSAEVIGLKLDYDPSHLVDAMQELVVRSGLTNGYIRPIAWTGDESLGIYAPENKTHVAIATWDWPSAFNQELVTSGLHMVTSDYRRPPANSSPYKAKAAGVYLNGAISRRLAANQQADDALMLDSQGYVAEATGANIFFCQGNEIITPTPDCFLDGITRQVAIKIAKNNRINVVVRKVSYHEISQFEGCFLTGTAYEIQPVRSIDSIKFVNNKMAAIIRAEYLKIVGAM